MNFTKLIIAALAASVVMFLVDGLWWMVIFKNYYATHMPANGAESVPMHYVGELCLAILMAIMYPFGYKGGSAVMEGCKFGLLIGLVYSLPVSIHEHADHFASLHLMGHNVLNGIIIGILGGITVALVYGVKKTAA